MKFSRRYILAVAAGVLVCVGSLHANLDVTPLLTCGLPQCPAYENAPAKDEWTQVKSKNFLLIGNASEKDIRKVATRLEQFRETFRLLFTGIDLTSPIETRVVVFKSDGSYKNFKPKRADGKIDTEVAGYFQPGEDVNYITLAVGGDEKETYDTIFHEYVHFIVNTNFGKSEVPPWFNEGLAEYYSTFEIKNDQEVHLGLPHEYHLELLTMSQLIPLGTLFNISNYALAQNGGHGRSIFYAESWALVHYLIQSGKSQGLSKFLQLIFKHTPADKAFQEAFQISYADMQKELAVYVSKRSFRYNIFTFNNKLTFDATFQAGPLVESDANAYLGDLLYHNNRADDAEPFLNMALAAQPDSSMANTTLGMVKIRQRKWDDARVALERAITGDLKNHYALYQYAYLVSRQAADEFGYNHGFDAESLAKMRSALSKAIAIAPAYAESYDLLAYVNMVAGEQLDESVTLLRTALKLQPGNQHYALNMAEILMRQKKFDDALAIAQKIAATADDPETRNHAGQMVNTINQRKNFFAEREADQKRYQEQMAGRSNQGEIVIVDNADDELVAINRALRKTASGETRVIGRIVKIDCSRRPLVYTVKTSAETFTVTTRDFDSLNLSAFTPEATTISVGCDADLSSINAVITYKNAVAVSGKPRGELVAIEFVKRDFKFVAADGPPRIARSTTSDGNGSGGGVLSDPPATNSPDIEARRRAAILHAINEGLKKPGDGQKREIGYLDKIDCSNKGSAFVLRTDTRTYRFRTTGPNALTIGVYVSDLAGIQFGCAIKPVEFPAVFIFNDKPDGKSKTDGELISLEFVPKSFVLDH